MDKSLVLKGFSALQIAPISAREIFVRFREIGTVGWVMALQNVTEPDLLRAFCKRRDEEAFRELVRRHLLMVTNVALRRIGDRSAAEEVAQNVFVKLARKAPTLREDSVIGAWLHHVAIQESADYHRKEYRRKRAMKSFREQQDEPDQFTDEDATLSAGLDEAMSRLSGGERAAILLRFQSGMRFREIGERLGKSEEAIRKQVTRTLEKLATKLGRRQKSAMSVATLVAALPLAFGKSASASPHAVAAVTEAALAANAATTSILTATFTLIMKSKFTFLGASALLLILASFVTGRHAAAKFDSHLTEQTINSAVQRERQAERAADLANRERFPPANPTESNKSVAEIVDEAAVLAREAGANNYYRLRLILDQLRPEDYAAAIEHLEGTLRDDTTVFQRLGSMLAGLWAHEDGAAAMAWARTNLDPTSSNVLGKVFRAWSKTDPEAAYQDYQILAAEGGSGMQLNSFRWLAKGVFAGWATHDPAGALDAFTRLSVEDEDAAVFGIAEAVVQNADPQPLLDAIGDLPESLARQRLISKVAGRWAAEEPHAAAAWVDTVPLPNAKARIAAKGEVAEEWMRYDRSEAAIIAAWFLSGAPDGMRASLTEMVNREMNRNKPSKP